ncbi:MAG: mechanosensitive ion channel family protein [Thalassotalea sp.]
MSELLIQWLSVLSIPEQFLPMAALITGLAIIIILAIISHYLAKHQMLFFAKQWASRTKNTFDDKLIDHKFFSRVASLVPSLVTIFLVPHLLIEDSTLSHVILVFARVAICFQTAQCISALMNVFNNIYRDVAHDKYIPLNSSIQVIKLVIYIVATILAASFVIDRSPVYLLSGLGALTAVLLLIFQDTIKGLVASIQISANRMVAPGDWVELPNYGADGDVIEIGLNTVKIRNFDKTITTVPTYALISGSFKNWRDMFHSGGRRIKRSILIDVSSISFYQQEDIEQLSSVVLIKDYITAKKLEITQWCQDKGIADHDAVNARQLTNIGTFRAYIEAYLQSHENVHQEMTCMVRQLPATATGLPLELYFFSNDQNWINYEKIQADIFDHIFAMAPIFKLRTFQHPTGSDWRGSQQ